MRNLYLTIFTLLALTFLGSIASLWEIRSTAGGRNAKLLPGAVSTFMLLPVAAVSAQESSGQEDEEAMDEPGETHPSQDDEAASAIDGSTTDNAGRDKSMPTTKPQVAAGERHGRHTQKRIQVDLSDLVVRPV